MAFRGLVFFIIFSLGIAHLACAEPVHIKSQVDKDKITIGDRITYEVVVEYEDGISIEPFNIARYLGEFEIKDYIISPPKKIGKNKWVSKVSYILTTFTTGEFTIPPARITYKGIDGKENEISSDEIKITVESIKPSPSDTDDIRPLKDPEYIKERFPWIAFILLTLVLGGTIGGVLYLKRKRDIASISTIPPRPPEEVAKEALKLLGEERLIERGLIKEYYIRLSDILRRYIELRYHIMAVDRTTWELYCEMRKRGIERDHTDRIRNFLEDCDLVKFAKYIPEIREIEEIYKTAEDIIELTTPKEAGSNIDISSRA